MPEQMTINAAATILLNNVFGMLDRMQDSNIENDICMFL